MINSIILSLLHSYSPPLSALSPLLVHSDLKMGRPPCCDKANVKRGLWTAEEDAKILAYVANHGVGNWTQVPKKAGLNRCGKSCRLRWTNYLRPDLKHEEFTEKEEELIVQYHAAIGSRWSLIAKQLPGRTDNDVKNYWNTKLKKKLIKRGIDPITHKPLSKIFSDYQNIRCLATNHQTSCLDNNLAAALSSQCTISPPFQSGIQINNTIRMPMVDQNHNLYSPNSNCLLQQESFNHYMEELSPSSSSSSSSSISNGQPNSCLLTSQPPSSLVISAAYISGDQSFTDPLQSTDVEEEEHNIQGFLATDLPCPSQQKNLQPELGGTEVKSSTSNFCTAAETTEISKQCEHSSSVSSFVKALLDRDSEMQLNFPLFGDILDY